MLPGSLLSRPIAHRAYHDKDQGRPENSPAAMRAAVAAGYGIEIDLQLSADGVPMVFHDYALDRLTEAHGPVALRSAAELAVIMLRHGSEAIPTLAQVLDIVAGQVPLLIEIKDQDGAMGPNIGPLEAATAQALKGYDGPLAVMSFNPHSMQAMARLAPDIPRGLTTSSFEASDWPTLSAGTCDRLREIPDFDAVGASFISHEANDLDRPRVASLKASGVPILCWTIRSPQAEAEARKIAVNVTFEGYPA